MIKALETKRLILKEISLEHETDYEEGFVDYEVVRHMSNRIPWPYPEGGVRYFLTQKIQPFLGKTVWQWGIFLKENPNKLIGSINVFKEDTCGNRGFWLARSYWGQGYMTEAVHAVNRYAFEELGFETLRFMNAKGNYRSSRIKEKTGGHLVKVAPTKAVDPAYTEAEWWELTKDAWYIPSNK